MLVMIGRKFRGVCPKIELANEYGYRLASLSDSFLESIGFDRRKLIKQGYLAYDEHILYEVRDESVFDEVDGSVFVM